MGRRSVESSRLLSATSLSLHGRPGALERLVIASDHADGAEATNDQDLFLVARTWRIVPLLELGETTAVAVEVEATRELAVRLREPAWARCGDLIRVAAPLFGGAGASVAAWESLTRSLTHALREPPPTPGHSGALRLLAELSMAIGDRETAELAYALAWHWKQAIPHSRNDPWELSNALGILSLGAGRSEAGGKHLGSSLEHAAVAPEPELLALTRHGVASLLAADAPAYALALLQSACDHYTRLGMHDARARAETLASGIRGAPEPVAGDPAPCTCPSRLAREGEYWAFEFEGRAVHLRDSKGIRDIFHLLAHPGRLVGALELMHAQGPPDGSGASDPARLPSLLGEGLSLSRPLALERSDPRALREYAETARELRADLDEASAAADLGRIELLRKQLGLLEQELEGRGRLGANDPGLPIERARKAVTKRIRREIRVIEEHHEALARHLRDSIRTGGMCAYMPRDGTAWDLDAPERPAVATREVAGPRAK